MLWEQGSFQTEQRLCCIPRTDRLSPNDHKFIPRWSDKSHATRVFTSLIIQCPQLPSIFLILSPTFDKTSLTNFHQYNHSKYIRESNGSLALFSRVCTRFLGLVVAFWEFSSQLWTTSQTCFKVNLQNGTWLFSRCLQNTETILQAGYAKLLFVLKSCYKRQIETYSPVRSSFNILIDSGASKRDYQNGD